MITRLRTAARLSLGAALITTAAAVIAALVVLAQAWRSESDRIATTAQRIRDMHVPAIRSDVWDMTTHLGRELATIADLPHVALVEVVADTGTVRHGTSLEHAERHVFPLDHPVGGRLGELRVEFSRDGLLGAALARWWLFALLVAVPVVAAGAAYTLLYRRLVGRHLIDLAGYVADLQLDRLDRPFAFRRGSVPADDELETVAHAVATMRANLAAEVGRRREAEERLRQLQKMETLGQLAGGVAHDFNNALTGILGSADLLRLELPADHPSQPLVATIAETSRRSADLTRKLLAFARKGSIVHASIDVHEAVRAVTTLLAHTVDRRITVTTRLHAGSSRIVGDPSEIENALLNLCLNAADAMPGGGELVIATAEEDLVPATAEACHPPVRPGRYLRLCVRDHGTGIEPAILSRLFEPFFTTKAVGKGTGLGLAAVFGTAAAHHGAVSVVSSPGKGSTFSVLLPLEPESAARRRATSVALPAIRPGRVLVIDDEPVVRQVARSLLERRGWSVGEAADGSRGLDAFREAGPWDTVLLDLIMPEMDGASCFDAIRSHDPRARIVITSGYARDTQVDKLLAQGACGFIAKPYLATELWRAIDAARA